MAKTYHALVLAAGRGPDDPMAKAYGVSHKCTLPVGGVPMLKRVVMVLRNAPSIDGISVSIEDASVVASMFPDAKPELTICASENSAPSSALAAIVANPAYPILITTADHVLLTPEMIEHFCAAATSNGADFSAGLARAEVIRATYPQAIRTYFRLGQDHVSGCNLFAVQNEKGLAILARWKYLEAVRKKPWRLVAAFGPLSLIRFAFGRMSLEDAFATVSKKLDMVLRPVLMPFAEAAIDVDKPSDLALAEEILKLRGLTTSLPPADEPVAGPPGNPPRTI